MTQSKLIDEHILNIIQIQAIAEQSDLQKLLKERGYDVPQATLSRRLKKLKIAKFEGHYRLMEFNTPSLPTVLNCQVSESGILVLHTHPGGANALAYFIDRKYVSFSLQDQKAHSGILGTIGGDDTVLLVLRSKDDVLKVMVLLHEDFPYLSHS